MSQPSPKIYLLPNLMTAGNLFCGFTGTLKIVEGALLQASNPDAAICAARGPDRIAIVERGRSRGRLRALRHGRCALTALRVGRCARDKRQDAGTNVGGHDERE